MYKKHKDKKEVQMFSEQTLLGKNSVGLVESDGQMWAGASSTRIGSTL